MNSEQIALVLTSDVRTRRVFRGVFARDRLPLHVNTRQPNGFVINTDPSYRRGEHWVSVWFDGKGRAEYFDSFGLPPLHPDIEFFIKRHSRSYRVNERSLQDLTSAACGLYVIYFIYMKSRGATLNRTLAPFHPHRPRTNDQLVYRILQPIFFKKRTLTINAV
mgnify:FL=1